METIERIKANGIGKDFMPEPYIDIDKAIDLIKEIAKKPGDALDSRPAFSRGTIVTQHNAVAFTSKKTEKGYFYSAFILSDDMPYGCKAPGYVLIPGFQFFTDKMGKVYENKMMKIEYNLLRHNREEVWIADDAEKTIGDIRDSLIQSVKLNNAILICAMTFLNCRNIVLVDKPQLPSIARHYEKRHKIPQVVYKELEVTPISYRHNYKATSVPANSIPLHLCRGHIKTYTEEKPLFGRITGQYYWNPHMRGNKENGEVVKDYKLVN